MSLIAYPGQESIEGEAARANCRTCVCFFHLDLVSMLRITCSNTCSTKWTKKCKRLKEKTQHLTKLVRQRYLTESTAIN